MFRNPRDKCVCRTGFVPKTVACKFESPVADDVAYSVKISIKLLVRNLGFPVNVLNGPQHAGVASIEAGLLTLC